jgi:hypothetical protein
MNRYHTIIFKSQMSSSVFILLVPVGASDERVGELFSGILRLLGRPRLDGSLPTRLDGAA